MNSQREAFEKAIKLDKGVYWCYSANCYMRYASNSFAVRSRTVNDKWEEWQAATESQRECVPDKREWNQAGGRDDNMYTNGWNDCRNTLLTNQQPEEKPE